MWELLMGDLLNKLKLLTVVKLLLAKMNLQSGLRKVMVGNITMSIDAGDAILYLMLFIFISYR